MSLSTEDRLQDAFRRALREDLQRNLRTPEDWDRFKAIQRETDARSMTEQASYARDYTKRIRRPKRLSCAKSIACGSTSLCHLGPPGSRMPRPCRLKRTPVCAGIMTSAAQSLSAMS